MTLELNKPILARRVAYKDGKLVFLPQEGFCDGVTIGKPVLAKRVAYKNEKLHFLLSDQKLDSDGKLIIGKPYLAQRVAEKDGKLHFVVSGVQCEPPTSITMCGCEICCTLAATVQVGDGTTGGEWSDPVDVDLTCGGTVQLTTAYFCLNNEIEDDNILKKFTTTYSEKDTIGSPTAWSDIGTSGTREVKTVIWASEEFEIDGDDYRLVVWVNGGTIYQLLPTEATTPFCNGGWMLQKKITSGVGFDTYGEYWDQVAGDDFGVYYGNNQWMFDVSNDNPDDPDECGTGYSYNGGDLPTTGAGCDTVTGVGAGRTIDTSSTGSVTDCPLALTYESQHRLTTDPDEEAYYVKCAKISIADLCDMDDNDYFDDGDGIEGEGFFDPDYFG